jgi:hypothetical protein
MTQPNDEQSHKVESEESSARVLIETDKVGCGKFTGKWASQPVSLRTAGTVLKTVPVPAKKWRTLAGMTTTPPG